MEYQIFIKSDKNFDRALYEVYLDTKKRIYLRKDALPSEYEKVVCECETNTQYKVRQS